MKSDIYMKRRCTDLEQMEEKENIDELKDMVQSIMTQFPDETNLVQALEAIYLSKDTRLNIMQITNAFDAIDDYQNRIQRKCCKSMVTDYGLWGYMLYLTGSTISSISAFFITDEIISKILGLIAISMYVIGGILFLYLGCKPWYEKSQLLNEFRIKLREKERRVTRTMSAILRLGVGTR